jgi:hypothetical protein
MAPSMVAYIKHNAYHFCCFVVIFSVFVLSFVMLSDNKLTLCFAKFSVIVLGYLVLAECLNVKCPDVC